MLHCRAVDYPQVCAYCERPVSPRQGHYADVVDERQYQEDAPASQNVIVSHYPCRDGREG